MIMCALAHIDRDTFVPHLKLLARVDCKVMRMRDNH